MSEKNLLLLSSVKLKLQTISSELSNLTIRDLDELKWNHKQIILTKLFHASKYLNFFTTELDEIESEKQNLLYALKQQNVAENELKLRKKEIESIFRTSFMRIFLKGLEKQRWPPSLVPFSDPLSEIMESNPKFLQALDFLLSIELPTVTLSTPPPQIPDKNLTPRSVRNGKLDTVPRIPEETLTEQTSMRKSHQAEEESIDFSDDKKDNISSSNIKMIQRLEYQNKHLLDRLQSLESAAKEREAVESSIYSLLLDFQEYLKSFETSTHQVICTNCNQLTSEKGSKLSYRKWDAKIEQLKSKWKEVNQDANKTKDCNDLGVNAQNYSIPENPRVQNQSYSTNLRQDLYQLTSIVSNIDQQFERSSPDIPFQLRTFSTQIKFQNDILLVSRSLLNRLADFCDQDYDFLKSSNLFCIQDKVQSLALPKSASSQIEELLSKALSEYGQLQKSFQFITMYSKELFSFLESILTNYKVFYLQKQENFLSHLKPEIMGESKSRRSNKEEPQANIFKSLKLIFQSVKHVESNIRISNPSSQDNTLVNPLDVLARGVFGKDVANIINSLRAAMSDFSDIENKFQECYDKHLAKFNQEIEEYNDIISNLLQLKQKNESIQRFNTQKKEFSPSPSQEKVRAKPSPRSAKGKRKPAESRPPFDLGLG